MNMKLKQLVKNLKNHIKMSVKNEAFLELFDVEGNSVIFSIQDIADLKEGIVASPDGEFLFADGKKVIIENGIVKEVILPEEQPVVEEPVVEETSNEVIVEEQPVVEEPVVEEVPLEEVIKQKDKEIEELKASIEELKSENESLKQELSNKEEVIKEAETELGEIQNFYTSLNKAQMSNREDIRQTGFSFSKK